MPNFCPDCGAALGELAPRPEVVSAEVQIARINAERDVEVARIGASVARRELETELAITELETDVAPEVAAAEAAAAVAVVEAGTPEMPDAPPVVVDEAPEQVTEVVDDAPPPAERTEGSQPPEPAAKRGIGLWGG